MKKFDIAILGAGASGCMCALHTDKKKKVLLIDKVSSPAKKLMVTGNGRCNFTNLLITPSDDFYNQNIDDFFKIYSQASALEYFTKIGLLNHIDDEKRVYPYSNYAKSLIDVICNELSQKKNISLAMNEEIISLSKENDVFIIETDKEKYMAEKVVVAMGGKSSEGIINRFNIKHKTFIPSLCALKTKENTKILSGTRVSPVKVTASTKDNKVNRVSYGEVLFKDDGLSGIVIFNLSSIFARTGKFEGKIIIDLMLGYTKEYLLELLTERKHNLGHLTINKFFEGMLANPIAYYILNKCKFNENLPCNSLTEKQLNMLVELIKNLEFNVTGNYDNNQIYAGGVLLTALDKNLQSKQVSNLYFCGECCDVDGECGGYNLQWAWTSGAIVAMALSE